MLTGKIEWNDRVLASEEKTIKMSLVDIEDLYNSASSIADCLREVIDYTDVRIKDYVYEDMNKIEEIIEDLKNRVLNSDDPDDEGSD